MFTISLEIRFALIRLLCPFRQEYAEDYPRSNRSAYEDYVNYWKYMGKNIGEIMRIAVLCVCVRTNYRILLCIQIKTSGMTPMFYMTPVIEATTNRPMPGIIMTLRLTGDLTRILAISISAGICLR